ncbi:MAG: endonuclease V [Candidatus Hodarchaeota archaeon]
MLVVQELLRDDYSFEQAEAIQVKYQNIISQSSKNNNKKSINLIKTIVGVDIAYYNKRNYDYGVACAVVWDLKQQRKEAHFFAQDRINFPYKPGFLGFRECKLLARVISRLPKEPDLIMCDGHGNIHPRRFGEAVQIGFALNVSSIGIAKNPFFGYSDWQKIEKIKGNKAPVWAKDPKTITKKQSNELLGYATCLKNGSKPVFISVGYKISLDIALEVSLITIKGHRQPEPLYLAHFLSKREINKS